MPDPLAVVMVDGMAGDVDARRAEALVKLEALRANFGQRLRERVEELRLAVAAAAAHTDETRAHAESLAHKLAGTAGSYGFAQVSVLAGELEQLLQGAEHDAERAAELICALQAELTD